MRKIAFYIIYFCFIANLFSQDNSSVPIIDLGSKFIPKGFLGIDFGSSPENALNGLLAQGYENNKIKVFDNHIEVKNFVLDNLNIEESVLKFNYNKQMYYGKAKIKIISEKTTDDSIAVYNKIKRSIDQKYRKNTKNSSRLKGKDKITYWSDSWEFKDKNNKNIVSEIKLWKDEKWLNYGKWQRESLIYMEYSSNFAPLNPKPNPGSISEAL
jgi:hypothetical protein